MDRKHPNDRPPNHYTSGRFQLLYCFVCNQPNSTSWVASGRCHACQWHEREA